MVESLTAFTVVHKPIHMTKTITLLLLAVVSLALSYFYEVRPAKSSEPAGAPGSSPVSPYLINSGDDIAKVLMARNPVFTFKPAPKEFYSKKLDIRFKSTADKELIETVSKWLGTPYRFGSSSRNGTDCSGFVTRIYRDVYGLDLSRSSRSMFEDVQRIKKDSVRTGDLVFFKRSSNEPIFHVGIYLKDGKFIHSASSSGVMVSSLNEKFYRNYYYAAGRVTQSPSLIALR